MKADWSFIGGIKKDIDKGLGIVAVDPDGEEEGFQIGDMLVGLIADTQQAPGVEIIKPQMFPSNNSS